MIRGTKFHGQTTRSMARSGRDRRKTRRRELLGAAVETAIWASGPNKPYNPGLGG
jgi:hypothetical protein